MPTSWLNLNLHAWHEEGLGKKMPKHSYAPPRINIQNPKRRAERISAGSIILDNFIRVTQICAGRAIRPRNRWPQWEGVCLKLGHV
jgi:hypothetical protein